MISSGVRPHDVRPAARSGNSRARGCLRLVFQLHISHSFHRRKLRDRQKAKTILHVQPSHPIQSHVYCMAGESKSVIGHLSHTVTDSWPTYTNKKKTQRKKPAFSPCSSPVLCSPYRKSHFPPGMVARGLHALHFTVTDDRTSLVLDCLLH